MPRRVLVHSGETADFAGSMRESGHGNRLKCDSCEVGPERGGQRLFVHDYRLLLVQRCSTFALQDALKFLYEGPLSL
jgi:hypothetical protein